jgi:hypothetical protein
MVAKKKKGPGAIKIAKPKKPPAFRPAPAPRHQTFLKRKK